MFQARGKVIKNSNVLATFQPAIVPKPAVSNWRFRQVAVKTLKMYYLKLFQPIKFLSYRNIFIFSLILYCATIVVDLTIKFKKLIFRFVINPNFSPCNYCIMMGVPKASISNFSWSGNES